MPSIALVGDRSPTVVAHEAIPAALGLAAADAGVRLDWSWVHTAELGRDVAGQLAPFDAIWCVPGSPYASTAGAVAAIRFTRETRRPFLGTCGGFQHAILEYAEAVWGVRAPAHAELDPDAPDPVIAPLACSLIEAREEVRFTPGSRLAAIYAAPSATEGYHCRYGIAARHVARLEDGALRVSARDAVGDVRAVELDCHPFFMATLYQPERVALAGRPHPLVAAFAAAAGARA
jgi:CTP synthase (UTP-ammonia lyase)